MDEKTLNRFRQQLVQLRSEIRGRRQKANRSWQALSEPESELEESASKELLSRELEQIEKHARTQERQIDEALDRIEEGGYGECEECGRRISPRRLRLVPWARFCVPCAERLERAEGDARPAEPPPHAEEEGPLDEEICETVLDQLREDGRVELEELEVRCEDGVVYLEGALPREKSRDRLHQIVFDTLGYDQVVENIRIDRQAWQRRDRSPGASPRPEPEAEDPFTSMRTGKPMTPPDRMRPEKSGKR